MESRLGKPHAAMQDEKMRDSGMSSASCDAGGCCGSGYPCVKSCCMHLSRQATGSRCC
ncbi:hypothetical protein NOVOSPHI9U_60178 [Novosphingobium sp. 9U]|nr:hypothetical protein NOVOSPHI9U_60178 [Novosphingobium sp. 9U]